MFVDATCTKIIAGPLGVNRTLHQINSQSDPIEYINSMDVPNEKPDHINFI